MASMAQQWAGKGMARAATGRLQEGNSGLPISGLRRELQRVAAASSIKATEDSKSLFSLTSEGHRTQTPTRASDTPDMFPMEIGSRGRMGGNEHAEYRLASSEAGSITSNDNDHQLLDVLDLALGITSRPAPDGSEPPPVRRLVRNLSGHLPASRPANGGLLKAKAYGKLMRSLSGHRPKSSRDKELPRSASQGGLQQHLAFAPSTRQLLSQPDMKMQGWPVKSCELNSSRSITCATKVIKSAPVAVPGSGQKAHKRDDLDDDGTFIPPHEFLSRKGLQDDSDQAAFGDPSFGRLKGLPSLRLRNIVLTKTGFFDGYTEMWQCPSEVSSVPSDLY